MQLLGVFYQIVILFFIVLVGYLAAKLKILDDIANEGLSKLVIHITAPALIISTVTGKTSLGSISDILNVLVIALGYYIIMAIISKPIVRLLRVQKEDEGLYRFTLIFSNISFMGFPVVGAIFGEGAIFYASIFTLPFNLLLYTLGIHLINKNFNLKSKRKFEITKLINPGILAVVIAMAIYIFKIQIPFVLVETIKQVGSITTPLALIVIGSSLHTIPLREVFKEKALYPIIFITLIAIPVIILLCLKTVIINKVIIGVTVIISGMPVASITVMFCNVYKGNTSLAAKAVLLSTIFSVISIPLLTYLLLIF
ncbi:MAG: AEC family transporter [Desulfitobacteriaceae bacterium]